MYYRLLLIVSSEYSCCLHSQKVHLLHPFVKSAKPSLYHHCEYWLWRWTWGCLVCSGWDLHCWHDDVGRLDHLEPSSKCVFKRNSDVVFSQFTYRGLMGEQQSTTEVSKISWPHRPPTWRDDDIVHSSPRELFFLLWRRIRSFHHYFYLRYQPKKQGQPLCDTPANTTYLSSIDNDALDPFVAFGFQFCSRLPCGTTILGDSHSKPRQQSS